MKRIFLIGLGLIFITGCAGFQLPGTVFTAPCTVYEDVGATPENSLICKKIKNPCAVHKLLATAAKVPVIWKQKEYTDMFEKWAAKIQVIVESGVTYVFLQDLIIMEIAKLNENARMALLILSDGIFVFDEAEIMLPVDKALVLMSLTDLRRQVAQMAILGG